MNGRDAVLVVNTAQRFKPNCLDYLFVLRKAKSLEFISQRQLNHLQVKYSRIKDETPARNFLSFVLDIIKVTQFEEIVILLDEIGCSDIALELSERKGYTALNQVSRAVYGNADAANNHALLVYHKAMKSYLDDNIFIDKNVYIAVECIQLMELIANATSPRRKQFLADKYAILMWLGAQTFRDEPQERRFDVLNKMVADVRAHPVSTELPVVIVLTQTAINFALNGAIVAAKATVVDIYHFLASSENPFARIIACHDIQYVHRLIYSLTRDPADLEMVIQTCSEGLCSMNGYYADDRMLLDRLFKLNMAQSLVGICPRFDIDETTERSPTQQAAAKALVEQIRDQHFQGIETRREMIYNLVWARLLALSRSYQDALACANRAAELAKVSNYFQHDDERIETFRRDIYNRVIPIEVL